MKSLIQKITIIFLVTIFSLPSINPAQPKSNVGFYAGLGGATIFGATCLGVAYKYHYKTARKLAQKNRELENQKKPFELIRKRAEDKKNELELTKKELEDEIGVLQRPPFACIPQEYMEGSQKKFPNHWVYTDAVRNACERMKHANAIYFQDNAYAFYGHAADFAHITTPFHAQYIDSTVNRNDPDASTMSRARLFKHDLIMEQVELNKRMKEYDGEIPTHIKTIGDEQVKIDNLSREYSDYKAQLAPEDQRNKKKAFVYSAIGVGALGSVALTLSLLLRSKSSPTK